MSRRFRWRLVSYLGVTGYNLYAVGAGRRARIRRLADAPDQQEGGVMANHDRTLLIQITREEVATLAGALAELEIAVHELETVKIQDAERLSRAVGYVRAIQYAFQKQDEADRAARALRMGLPREGA